MPTTREPGGTGGTRATRPKRPPARPRRGTAADTRQRLIAAATAEFGRVGYLGTDSNRLARAAGYAPGVFYRHFADKRELFLEVYRAWIASEWHALLDLAPAAPGARAIVDLVLARHAEHRGLRRSLRVLAATDDVVRATYQRERRRQLDWLAERAPHLPRARAALLLYMLERAADGAADSEPAALDLDPDDLAAALAHELETALAPTRPR